MNWIVSELFFPDEVSTAHIITEIALKKIDNEQLSVICGPSGYEKTYNSQIKELDSRIKVYRVRLPKLDKNKLFHRFIMQLILTIKMGWMILIKVKKGNKVLITTNPSFLLIVIYFLKKIIEFKLEILVHDVFPDNLLPIGLLKKNTLKYEFLNKIYNLSYQCADRIIVLGEDMRRLMLEKISPNYIKIDIVPNWAEDNIRPLENFNITEYLELDVKDKIVFGFAGNLGRLQGLLEFIDLFLLSNNQNIVLIIIGDGAMRGFIEKKIKNLNNIFYLGPKPRHEQNFFLNACDIGVITLIKGMKGLGVPSKTYNLMAAGKPIFYIGDEESEIDNYINKYSCGWSFSWTKREYIIFFLNQISTSHLYDIQKKGNNSFLASLNYTKNKIINLI